MENQAQHISLSESDAVFRKSKFGPNELPRDQKKSWSYFVFKTLKEPMLLLLIAACTLYLILGDWEEGIALGLSVFVVVGLSLYQEQKSTKALEKLKQLSSPRARVIRDGIEKRISASELVPGDIVLFSEGDRVPADGILLEATNVTVDESLLTGESLTVEKKAILQKFSDIDSALNNFQSLPKESKIFSSTLVVSGRGVFRACVTGSQTQVGKIGSTLQEPEIESLNLHFEVKQMVKIFAIVGVIISLSLVILYGLSKGTWINAILLGLATQMSLLPEEFPVILAVFMALGAWRLSKVNVLVRNAIAIERLGAVSVLCVDKTGTLTQNKMKVAKIFDGVKAVSTSLEDRLSFSHQQVIKAAAMASPKDPFDPMEISIHELAAKQKNEKLNMNQTAKIVKEIGLSETFKGTTFFWNDEKNAEAYSVFVKGAPESVLDRCELSQLEKSRLKNEVQKLASEGMRVLGVASTSLSKTKGFLIPSEIHFSFLGLIGFEDPLRNEVPEAVKICRQAGVRVIMMTGDHSQTAHKIGQQAGLDTSGSVITGNEIELMSEPQLEQRLQTCNIFARMQPENKLRLVKSLRSQNKVVAMTGDGVNDAPSLKWADIGIAMGLRGTDVAREASDLVLMDDNFASIVSGIQRGRTIFHNIRKAVGYVVSVHVPIAGLAILPVMLGWPIILLPAHIVLLEIIIDPVCSLLFESLDSASNIMKEPPRRLGARLFSLRDYARSFLQGFLVLIVLISVFVLLNSQNLPESKIRTFIFFLLILLNMILIVADVASGSFTQVKKMLAQKVNAMATGVLILAIYVIFKFEISQKIFAISQISLREILYCFGISFIVLGILSFWNRFKIRPN